MKKRGLAVAALVLFAGTSARAGLFDQGIGSAMYYGPYTGGHPYSYNSAYGYGLSFSPADSWWRDPFAYPGGVYPYRPYGRPIYYQVFPKPDVPYVWVVGPDGRPTLVAGAAAAQLPPPDLAPVPGNGPPVCATIRISVPAGAEVWFDTQKTSQAGTDRVFQSPPVAAGKMLIYTVRAKWDAGGGPVEQVRIVGVRAGETARVKFSADRP